MDLMISINRTWSFCHFKCSSSSWLDSDWLSLCHDSYSWGMDFWMIIQIYIYLWSL